MSTGTLKTRSKAPRDPGERRFGHTVRWVSLAVVAVLVAAGIFAATRPSSQATAVQSPLVGRDAPTLSGAELNGATFSLASDRGKFVVVNFFASWCPPCAQEEPNLFRLAFEQERQRAKLALVSVDIDDTTAGARRFLGQWNITWPVVADRDGRLADAYGVGSPPETFVLGPRGRVLAALVGPVSYDQLDSVLVAARG
ncbi:MAG: TlpA family protein disulfide reductase [Acidimicrobiales bacterium]